jgi:predicted SprT family Zn-dependent metalloprotease
MNNVLFDFSAKKTADRGQVNNGNAYPDLRDLFNEINRDLFKDQIPSNFPVIWCNRIRVSAGTCATIRTGNKREVEYIRLSIQLFENNGWNPNEIRLTMIHEMVHAYLFIHYEYTGHGRQFQSMMNRLVGFKNDHTYHNYDVNDLRNTRRSFVDVYCTSCNKSIGSLQRKPNRNKINRMVHTICGGAVTYETKYLNSNTVFDLSK